MTQRTYPLCLNSKASFKIYQAWWFLGLLFWLTFSWAASPVWKVTKTGGLHDTTLYLAGTIHLLGEQDYPLPPGYDAAYQQAEQLAFEIDLRETQTPRFQQAFLMQMRYPYGETLQQHLKSSTYLTLKRFLRKRNIDIKDFQNYRVGFVSMNLTLIELKRMHLDGTGVDQFYLDKAVRDGKPIKALETTDAHFETLARLGEGNEDAYLKYSLNEVKDLPDILAKTKQYWRNGNLKGFEDDLMRPIQTEFPQVYQSLLVQRNQHWMPQIEEMLRSTPTEMVLVGNLHLAGPDGLIAQLKHKGYEITQLP